MTNSKNIPKRRFPGFEGEWEQEKFGKIATIINGRAYSQDELLSEGKYKVLRVGNFYTNESWYYSNLELDNKYYANNGDLLYTWSATFGPHIWSGDKVIYHYHIWKVELSERIDKKYILQLLEKDKSDILSNKNGSTMVHITKDGMENKLLMFPEEIEEQTKIGSFLKQLDQCITLHQHKLDKLKNLKKSYLAELFPAEGERVPKRRFPGFEGEWEEKKLNEVIKDFIVPMRDKPKEFSGNIPWTRIEDIEGKYISKSHIGYCVSSETIKRMNLKIIPEGSLIVSASATFGVVAIVKNELITNQTFIGLVPQNGYEIEFLYYLFQSPKIRAYMKEESAGSTIFYISRESFENMDIELPNEQERKLIINQLNTLDSLLSLQQQKLEKLKNLKKAYLNELFV